MPSGGRGAGLCVALCALCVGCAFTDTVGGAPIAIVGGEATSDHPAVGALVFRRTACGQVPLDALCTVTLVAPDVVITAGHCVQDYRSRQLEVLFGEGLDDPAAVYRVVTEHVLHPSYDDVSSDADLALLALASPVDIAPVDLSREPLGDESVGTSMLVVGFGETSAASGAKRQGTVAVEAVDAATFRYGPGPAMTCRGDSGGPAFVAVGADHELVGVTSAGDSACEVFGVDTRIDVHVDFIESTLAVMRAPDASTLQAAALCTEPCTTDEQCPSRFVCEVDDTGVGLCAAPTVEAGAYEGVCVSDADCAGADTCRPFDDGCLCHAACEVAPDPPPPDPGSGGCSMGGAAREARAGWALAVVGLALWLRRSQG